MGKQKRRKRKRPGTKDNTIQFRASEAQRERWEAAAEKQERCLSEWLRDLADQASGDAA